MSQIFVLQVEGATKLVEVVEEVVEEVMEVVEGGVGAGMAGSAVS